MKHHWIRCAVLAAVAWGLPLSASASNLKLSMHDGLVTIVADQVSVTEILQEWSRVGQTVILNADKVTGPLVTIQLVNVPERDALDTLLRSASGYIAAPRPVPIAGASVFDRVTIMPVSHPPASSAVAAAPPVFQRPPSPNDEEDSPVNVALQREIMQREQEARSPVPPAPAATNPAFQPYPGAPPPAANQGPTTSAQPGVVLTSPQPGALPVPQTPNGTQPAARPGGGGPGGSGGGQP